MSGFMTQFSKQIIVISFICAYAIVASLFVHCQISTGESRVESRVHSHCHGEHSCPESPSQEKTHCNEASSCGSCVDTEMQFPATKLASNKKLPQGVLIVSPAIYSHENNSCDSQIPINRWTVDFLTDSHLSLSTIILLN